MYFPKCCHEYFKVLFLQISSNSNTILDIDPTHVQVQVWAQVQIFKYGWFPTLHTTCMLFIYREGAVGGAGLVGWGVVLLAWIGVKASPKPCTCGLEVTFNPRHKTWDIVPHVCTSTPCFCMTRCIYFQLALFACTTFGHSLFTSPCFFLWRAVIEPPTC